MNRRLLFGFILLILVPISTLAGDKSPWETKQPFKQATLKYTISGVENGKEIRYIRGYGREVAIYHTTKTSMMGMVMINENVEISNPEWEYNFDLTNHTGSKNVNPEKYMIEEYRKLSQSEKKQVHENVAKMGTSVAEGLGGKIQLNAEKILGYSCDKVEMMGTVTYSIHNTEIPLRINSNMMGIRMVIEATSVDIGKVEDRYFELPQGIEVIMDPQSDAIARSMAKETITTLKDPEGSKKFCEEAKQEKRQFDEELTPEDKKQME